MAPRGQKSTALSYHFAALELFQVKEVSATWQLVRIRPSIDIRNHDDPDMAKPAKKLAPNWQGIKEVQIIQWFVEPEARVEEFDKLCEVQSDKAAVEITSRFEGVIKKLHYQAEDMAQVGQPLCDIDTTSDVETDNPAALESTSEQAGSPSSPQQPQKQIEQHQAHMQEPQELTKSSTLSSTEKHRSLATPAVRGLLKDLKLDISQIAGTGKDGRILKEDVQKHAALSHVPTSASSSTKQQEMESSSTHPQQNETPIPLTPIQTQMFKTMTRSLSIPHFLYTDDYNISALSKLRSSLNSHTKSMSSTTASLYNQRSTAKLSYLPFIIKALSLALDSFPILNSRIDTDTDPSKPRIIMRSQHNISIAIDTPQGLIVPNIKAVNTLSILDIAAEISRLRSLALQAKLSPKDLTGGTITVSNIGSIGGNYVAPVIVQNEVAILGVGKKRVVPAFADEGDGDAAGGGGMKGLVRKEMMSFSWSADHRVVDGATVARCSEFLRGLVEGPEVMVVRLK
ncbi:MAG: hypothetical protein Q9220_001225 [cf. Caloplaca sp. 1 TL-2023]